MSTEHLLGDVDAILNALMGNDDQRRKEAEQHLNRLTGQAPADILLVLAQIGAQGVGGFQLDQRLLSLILLRRLAFTALPGLHLNAEAQSPSAPFDVVAERVRGRIEVTLCSGLREEMNTKMRKGLGSCTGLWAKESSVRYRPCLAVPPVLLDLTTSPHAFHRFTPFQLLSTTPTLLVDSVTDPIPASQLAGLLMAGLNDSSVDVKIEAVKATGGVLQEGVTGKEREEVGPGLVHQIFQILPGLPDDCRDQGLLPLVDLASLHPNLFIPTLPNHLPYLLSLLAPPSVDLPNHLFSTYKASSLPFDDFEKIANPVTEILLSLCELRRAQILAWEEARAVRESIGLLMARLVAALGDQGEECNDWLIETNLNDEDEEYPAFTEESLDRLANAVGGETLLSTLSEQVQALIRHSDWRCRYTALVSIASMAEGCLDEVRPRLPDILSLISPSAKDPHPRVRYAFLQCLGQLCTDCEGLMQGAYPKEILEICLELLSDPITRVRAHAAACLCNFFGDADVSCFPTLLGPVMERLLTAYEDGPLYLKEQILTTITTIASQAEADFAPFYRTTMDFLLKLLMTQANAEYKSLIGKAIECATMIGVSVGKPTFAPDSVHVAEILTSLQNGCTESDDPRTTYLMEGWANLARALGADFAPFLPHVIPPLLKSASFQPSIVDLPPSLDVGDAGDDSYFDVTKTNSTELNEKIVAFDNLAVYAYTLRGAFQPWLPRCVELSLDALSFRYSEDVREAAAFLVPALLQVAKESRAWQTRPAELERVFKTMINVITKEVDFGYLALLYKSFTDSLHLIGTSLPPDLMAQILRETNTHLEDLSGRRSDRKSQEPYMDEGDRELYYEEQEEEDVCLDHMAKTLDMLGRFTSDEATAGQIEHVLKRCAQVRSQGLAGGPEG